VAVVDVHVDPEVVAGEAVLVEAARIEERAANRMLRMQRRDGPPAIGIPVVVVEAARERARDPRLLPPREVCEGIDDRDDAGRGPRRSGRARSGPADSREDCYNADEAADTRYRMVSDSAGY
jgi:hypothetical protein